MAQHKSAKTRIRRNERRRVINKKRSTAMRNVVRSVREAITAGNKAAAQEALKNAQPEIHRSAGRGIVHKKTAARILSRLSARIKALA